MIKAVPQNESVRCAGLQTSESEGNVSGLAYDVLRQSLTSSQRRCASLNDDMLHIAAANEELLTSLQVMKDTNRRLSEQIQFQNEEISRLTQKRLDDELKFEDMCSERRLSLEGQRVKLDYQLEVTLAHEEAAFKQLKNTASAKLELCRHLLQEIAKQIAGFQQIHAASSPAIRAELSAFQKDFLKSFCLAVDSSIAKHLDQSQETAANLNDRIHALRAEVSAASLGGQLDLRTTTSRAKELQVQCRALADATSEASANLEQKVSKVNSHRLEESHSAAEHLTRCGAQLSALMSGNASKKVKLVNVANDINALEVHCRHMKEDQMQTSSEYTSCQQRLRETDEALDAAVQKGDSLRRTMETQRKDCERLLKARLQERHKQFLDGLNQIRSKQQHELHILEQDLERIEKVVCEHKSRMDLLELEEESLKMERTTLEAERMFWKSQKDLSMKANKDAEKKLARVLDTCNGDLKVLRLEEAELTERKQSRRNAVDAETEKLRFFQDESYSKASKAFKEIAVLEGSIQKINLSIASAHKVEHHESSELQTPKRSVHTTRTAVLEEQAELERLFCELEQEASTRRARLEEELDVERRRVRHARNECEALQWQALPPPNLTRNGKIGITLQDIDLQKQQADVTEKEIQETQQRLQKQEEELQGLTSRLSNAQERVKSFKQKLKARGLLHDSQHVRPLCKGEDNAVLRNLAPLVGRDSRLAASPARLHVAESLSRMQLRTNQLRSSVQNYQNHEPVA